MGLRAPPIAVLVLVCCTLGGCSREQDEALPAACLGGADAVERALERAPGTVTLDGARLSDCLGAEGDAQALQAVGGAYLEAAVRLGDQARARPGGPAALRLGYLVGAVGSRGDAEHGVNYELVRRIRQEGTRVGRGSTAYRRGERAGHRDG